MGKFIFTIFSGVAELERDLIRERVRAGLQHARQKGIKLGRPTVINEDLHEKIQELRSKEYSIRNIARQVKVSPSLVHKILSNFKGADTAKSSLQEIA